MRRTSIFLTLIIILGTMVELNRVVNNWHYIVPAEPGELLYAASFDDGDDWQKYDSNQLSVQVNNTVLTISVHQEDEALFSAASPYFADFDFEVDVWAMEGVFDGTNNNSFGVVFRQRDNMNYYVFYISSDGYYRVKRMIDGEPKFLSAWNFSEDIQQGLGEKNHLRIVGYEDRFQFYINGMRVALCIPASDNAESTPLPNGECRGGSWQSTLIDDAHTAGRIGMIVEADVVQPVGLVVEFDNVLIYGPRPFSLRE